MCQALAFAFSLEVRSRVGGKATEILDSDNQRSRAEIILILMPKISDSQHQYHEFLQRRALQATVELIEPLLKRHQFNFVSAWISRLKQDS